VTKFEISHSKSHHSTPTPTPTHTQTSVTTSSNSNQFLFIYLKEVRPADVQTVDERQRNDVRATREVSVGTVLDMTAD